MEIKYAERKSKLIKENGRSADFTYPHQPLSFLLAEIAIKNSINWSFVEEYKK